MKLRSLIGTARCGKSISQNILISSGEFAWMSEQHSVHPNFSFLGVWNRVYNLPTLGMKLYKLKDNKKFRRVLPQPIETNSFWRKHIPDFEYSLSKNSDEEVEHNSKSLISEKNISKQDIDAIRNLIRNILKWQNKEFFLLEYSKWPKMSYFSKAFPNTKFVHVIRDGRVVAYEYHKSMTVGQYVEWQRKDWWIDIWPKDWKEEYLENYNGDVLAFCAYLWKFQLKLIWEDAKNIPKKNYMEVSYKNLSEKPKKTFSKIFDFYGSKFNERVEHYLKHKNLKNMNYKWKKKLSSNQREMLEEIIHEEEYRQLLDNG